MKVVAALPDSRRLVLVAALVAMLLGPGAAYGQEQRYAMAVRGLALDAALEQFVEATGRALAYDPQLVRGHRAFCAVEDAPAEAVLRCLLRDSGLDFYRLSSGTFVLTAPRELAPRPGYVAGTVLDGDTSTPLADAHVYLHEASLGSVTNRAGQFVFSPVLPGRYAITVSYVGYQTWRDTLDVAPHAATRTEATLQPEPILITPVVVDGLQERAGSSALAWSRLDGPHLDAGPEAAPLHHGLQPLTSLAGVRVGDATAGVHVQGGEGGEHQLRLDGVPVFMPRHLVGFIGPFNAFALDRITVHKAGFGAAHGSHTAGVIAAEHHVPARSGVDVQADPLSFNARVQQALGAGDRLAWMAAGRVGLGDVYRPAALQSTLDAWTAPDLFLILAPLSDRRAAGAMRDVLDGLPGLLGSAAPRLDFADLHAAARLRFGPLRTLQASLYHGRSSLGGGVLSDAAQLTHEDVETPPFTVIDDYDWENTLGQLRYSAVLGGRTLLSVQARGSRYGMDHRYQVLDSLQFHLQATSPAAALADLATLHVRDGNGMRILALEASLDHARGRHHARLGFEASHVRSHFDLHAVNLGAESVEPPIDFTDTQRYAGPDLRAVTNRAGAWWLAAYVEDVVDLGARAALEGGVRLTYRPERATVYAEPRLALRYDGEAGPFGTWSTRTAAGLYRQFVNEYDVSKLNAGALLPAVRIWLPVDATVRPPLAYHLAQAFLLKPAAAWTLRAEGYYKYHPHSLAVRYQPAYAAGVRGPVRSQQEILTHARGQAYGAALSAEWKPPAGRLYGLYEYSHATRRSPDLFGGRTEAVPWNEPHRVVLAAEWQPTRRLTLSGRWLGVWGRSWGFRRAYYDYFGHTEATRYHAPYDLGRPSEHVLPPLYQLDAGLAYTHPLGPARLQLRLDVLNVLDRANVADWRLVTDDRGVRKAARPLYPRIPSLAARLTF